MADNFATDADGAVATKSFAADEIASVLHPRVKIEHGADGSATDVSSANPLPVTALSSPAASRTTDSVAVAHQTDAIMNGATVLTPKYAKANVAASSTDSSIVAAVASKKIRVLSFRLHAGATATNVTFNSKPAGAGTAVSELFACGANGGRAEAFSPAGHFETAAGEGLTVTTGAGSTTGVGIVYVEV